MLEDMDAEIPAFIHYLSTRKLKYPDMVCRTHFDPKIYETEAFMAVVERMEKRLHREIKEYLRDKFITFRQKSLFYTPTDFADEYGKSTNGFRITKSDFADYCKYELGKKPIKMGRYNLWFWGVNSMGGFGVMPHPSKTGTPYEFFVEDYLTEDEINELTKNE